MADLDILVINYKTPAYTIGCLESLEAERKDVSLLLWILENGSGDDSAQQIREALQQNNREEWVRLIESTDNLGFAGGNNHLLTHILNEPSPSPYILLLNNDTVVKRGCLASMLSKLKADDRISLFSCMLRNADGSLQRTARKLPTPLRETMRAFGLPYILPRLFGWADLECKGWNHETDAHDVEWVGGAFMGMRLETARETGLFDLDFFFYGEDMELCRRLRKRGGRVVYDPEFSIIHYGGASSDSTRLRNRHRDILRWRARFMVQQKCYGTWARRWSYSCFLTAFVLHRWYLVLRRRRHSETYAGVVQGIWQLRHLSASGEET